jgi:hypothetical protein
MARYLCLVVVVAASALLAAGSFADDPPKPAELPLVFEENFAKGAAAWEPSDPAAWKVIDTPRGKALSQFQQSKFQPPHRSPFNIALVKGVTVGDLVLDADVQSTTRDYPHRDAVLVFGYQDPAHFYYVHFGKATDDHANQIFIVNDKPRVKISTKTTAGTPWTDNWHHLRVARKVADGTIEVYFDDLKTPVMTATDKTFTWGRVGVGTFDDTAHWTGIKLRGTKVEKK